MLSGTGRGRRDSDRGTVAVIVAITLSLVLMAVGALAVDLGNAFARRRALQNSADLAAMAGAGKLPDIDEARTAALANLCGSATEEGLPSPATTSTAGPRRLPADPSSATWVCDGDLDNGEIALCQVARRRGPVPGHPAGHLGPRHRDPVVTPAARVDYGLARGCRRTEEPTSAVPRPGSARARAAVDGERAFYLRGDENGAFCLKQPEPGGQRRQSTTTPATTLDEID